MSLAHSCNDASSSLGESWRRAFVEILVEGHGLAIAGWPTTDTGQTTSSQWTPMKIAEIRKLIAADPATRFARKPSKYDQEIKPLFVLDAANQWCKTSHWHHSHRSSFTMRANPHTRHTEVICAVLDDWHPSNTRWSPKLVSLGQIVLYETAEASIAVDAEYYANGQNLFAASEAEAMAEVERLMVLGFCSDGKPRSHIDHTGPEVAISSWQGRSLATGISISIVDIRTLLDLLDEAWDRL